MLSKIYYSRRFRITVASVPVFAFSFPVLFGLACQLMARKVQQWVLLGE